MTKQQEINLLRELAGKLGTETYIGEWLAREIPGIECSIRSDIIPDVSISEQIERTEQKCEEMLRKANEMAGKIVDSAEQAANNLMQKAEYERNLLLEALREATRKLEAI